MFNREPIKQGATLRDTVPRVPRSSTTRPTLDQVPSEERTETTVTKRDNPWPSTMQSRQVTTSTKGSLIPLAIDDPAL